MGYPSKQLKGSQPLMCAAKEHAILPVLPPGGSGKTQETSDCSVTHAQHVLSYKHGERQMKGICRSHVVKPQIML